MATVSLCFSGHPRRFLMLRDRWADYLAFLRERHTLRIFFHSWSSVGSALKNDTHFVEGTYDEREFGQFDELIAALRPTAFSIDSAAPELDRIVERFPPALLTLAQAGRRPLLSQLYSIHRADLLRQNHDRACGRSDAVIKLRFDLYPAAHSHNEIDFVTAHPDAPLIFAPSPHHHCHPGGGGGCVRCHAFFDEAFRRPAFETSLDAFLQLHDEHTNDICDLYAVAGADAMTCYSSSLHHAASVYRRIVATYPGFPAPNWTTTADANDPRDTRVLDWQDHPGGLETAPFFFPEKILRFGLAGHAVVHGESGFAIFRG